MHAYCTSLITGIPADQAFILKIKVPDTNSGQCEYKETCSKLIVPEESRYKSGKGVKIPRDRMTFKQSLNFTTMLVNLQK